MSADAACGRRRRAGAGPELPDGAAAGLEPGAVDGSARRADGAAEPAGLPRAAGGHDADATALGPASPGRPRRPIRRGRHSRRPVGAGASPSSRRGPSDPTTVKTILAARGREAAIAQATRRTGSTRGAATGRAHRRRRGARSRAAGRRADWSRASGSQRRGRRRRRAGAPDQPVRRQPGGVPAVVAPPSPAGPRAPRVAGPSDPPQRPHPDRVVDDPGQRGSRPTRIARDGTGPATTIEAEDDERPDDEFHDDAATPRVTGQRRRGAMLAQPEPARRSEGRSASRPPAARRRRSAGSAGPSLDSGSSSRTRRGRG